MLKLLLFSVMLFAYCCINYLVNCCWWMGVQSRKSAKNKNELYGISCNVTKNVQNNCNNVEQRNVCFMLFDICWFTSIWQYSLILIDLNTYFVLSYVFLAPIIRNLELEKENFMRLPQWTIWFLQKRLWVRAYKL